MKIASVASVKAKFNGNIRASQSWLVIVAKNGKQVAALLAMQTAQFIAPGRSQLPSPNTAAC